MLDGKQRKMLASLLDKPYRKVKIDRLIDKQPHERLLLTETEEILKRTQTHFQNQFRKRNFDQSRLNSNWEEIYYPKPNISREWYNNLEDEIGEEEWQGMLAELKNNTAPGVSGITYTLLKAANISTQKIFRTFAWICIKKARIPDKWKISQIYPIPKDTDWGYDLNNVRPIALLETFRKCMTKIFTRRLVKVIRERDILKGPNFAGLPGNSTETPIHILNAIVEDAKEKNKELWLVFQDMKKAFDSVSLISLEMALQRIKLPENNIKLVIELFYNRKSKVITDVGTTDLFTIDDGIDQGEVISPLVW
jgi:hypothetical protein